MIERYALFDLAIAAIVRSQVVAELLNLRHTGGGYVCFVNAHTAVESTEDAAVLDAIKHADIAFPDGTPVYLAGKFSGALCDKISGPDVFPQMLNQQDESNSRHYLYGGKPEVVERLMENIRTKFPHAEIVGAHSPPFRELSDAEVQADLDNIVASRADFVWIGLGAPKQELWMRKHAERLRPAVLLGVGAAFDFHAGAISRAPEWMIRIGCEWLHRLIQEPRRLWRRYLTTNSKFIYKYLVQTIR